MSHAAPLDSASSSASEITEGTSSRPSLSCVETETARLRRAKWRAGFDAGLKAGASRYFQSETMVDLAVELTLLRTLFIALCNEVEHRGKVLASINRIKVEALTRVVELARELDRRAPGWDRQ
jgi:hypothetical protein